MGTWMGNVETQRGRVDVRGRVREAAVWDGTPSAGAHPLVAGQADAAAATTPPPPFPPQQQQQPKLPPAPDRDLTGSDRDRDLP